MTAIANACSLSDVFDAIAANEPVFTPDGIRCQVIKLKNGRAKVLAIFNGAFRTAWIAVERLTLKPN